MRFLTAVVSLFVVFVILPTTNSVSADENKFTSFIVSSLPPQPIDATKVSLIKDGMTLKAIVSILSPGWVSPDEGVGVIAWFFNNGRMLNVLPHWDNQTEIITFQGHDGLARMWWSTYRMSTIKNHPSDH